MLPGRFTEQQVHVYCRRLDNLCLKAAWQSVKFFNPQSLIYNVRVIDVADISSIGVAIKIASHLK